MGMRPTLPVRPTSFTSKEGSALKDPLLHPACHFDAFVDKEGRDRLPKEPRTTTLFLFVVILILFSFWAGGVASEKQVSDV